MLSATFQGALKKPQPAQKNSPLSAPHVGTLTPSLKVLAATPPKPRRQGAPRR